MLRSHMPPCPTTSTRTHAWCPPSHPFPSPLPCNRLQLAPAPAATVPAAATTAPAAASGSQVAARDVYNPYDRRAYGAGYPRQDAYPRAAPAPAPAATQRPVGNAGPRYGDVAGARGMPGQSWWQAGWPGEGVERRREEGGDCIWLCWSSLRVCRASDDTAGVMGPVDKGTKNVDANNHTRTHPSREPVTSSGAPLPILSPPHPSMQLMICP